MQISPEALRVIILNYGDLVISMVKMDDYTVWIGTLLVVFAVIGATLYIPLLIITLLGMVGVTLTAVFFGVQK